MMTPGWVLKLTGVRISLLLSRVAAMSSGVEGPPSRYQSVNQRRRRERASALPDSRAVPDTFYSMSLSETFNPFAKRRERLTARAR